MANFDQRRQNVDNQYNAGRDQIIQNITIVGRFLEFAEIEGLIPKASESSVEQINITLEKSLDDLVGGSNIAEAIAFAGEILRETLVDWRHIQKFAAIRTRNVLTELAPKIISKLKQLGYWDTLCEKYNHLIYWPDDAGYCTYDDGEIEVIWLESIERLWRKYIEDEDIEYGLARVRRTRKCLLIKTIENFDIFVVMSCGIKPAYNPNNPFDKDYNFTHMKPEELRIFMVGLVIDLIRMRLTALDDIKLWDGLINLVK